jgi:hypothetical protein
VQHLTAPSHLHRYLPEEEKTGSAKKDKKKAAADDENPENLPSQPNNTLFGKQTSATTKRASDEDAAAHTDAAKPAKRKLAPVSKEDPAGAHFLAFLLTMEPPCLVFWFLSLIVVKYYSSSSCSLDFMS